MFGKNKNNQDSQQWLAIKQNCQILRIVYRQNRYLEIYLTDTLYTLDREKVDEVSRE